MTRDKEDKGDKKVEDDPEQTRDTTVENIKSIVLYALSLSVALGFNDLIISVFDSFPHTHHIISKTTYVIIMFGITLFAAYWLSTTVKT